MNKRLRYYFVYQGREYTLSSFAQVVHKSKYTVVNELKKLGVITDTDDRPVRRIEVDRKLMTHLIANRRAKDADRTNPCIDCAKAGGKCSWSRDFIPVKGWVADKIADTYEIISCPEFDLDDKPIDIDDFDDKGVDLLIRKIIISAIQDYRKGIRHNDPILKSNAEQFFRDEEFLSFTEMCRYLGIRGIDVDAFLERIAEKPEVENFQSVILFDQLKEEVC